jgi:hypothetical protein
MGMYFFMQWLNGEQDKLGNQPLDSADLKDNFHRGYLQALNDVEAELEKQKLIYQDGGQL